MPRRHDTTPFNERAISLPMRCIGERVIDAPAPLPVRAWIMTVAHDVALVDAQAIAWTDRAVRIRYLDRHDRVDTAWVWASAVTRRPADEQPDDRI